MISTLSVCLVLATFTAEASLYGVGPGLYTNYQGEYAAAYDNYIPKPYAFEYGVSDPHTGDHKNQWETKDEAGVVRGSYSLLESDGSTRIVDYIADDHGFRAVVKRIGLHGQSVENHGGPVLEAPLISPIVVAEQAPIPVEPIQVPEPAPIHVNYQTPLPVEAAPLYHSYDGGLEHYQNLYNTQPLPFSVPQGVPQGAYVELPRHQFGGYIQQPFEQSDGPLFAPSQPQGPIQAPPQVISSKLDDLEQQYGPQASVGYQVPQYVPQAQPVEPQSYQGPGTVQGSLPVDDYSLELAYGQPNGLGAPKLQFGAPVSVGNGYVPRPEPVVPQSYAPPIDNGIGANSYASAGAASSLDGAGPRASYEFVQQYGPDDTGDIRLNQGEYLPPTYGRQATEHK